MMRRERVLCTTSDGWNECAHRSIGGGMSSVRGFCFGSGLACYVVMYTRLIGKGKGREWNHLILK